ncbi:MAG: SDR family NAD(P)-dependent oxidoreductase, partial [Eubacteriales bacterium]|nr:SDR family NAD(P)-dependent oxidoreductase [Eubacteriales bacterium]
MRLLNRAAFITGAGSGIGREIAMAFAQEGAFIIAADLNLEAA